MARTTKKTKAQINKQLWDRANTSQRVRWQTTSQKGYDFYLSSVLSSPQYPSGLRLPNGGFSEKNVCWSLIDHDALYNFLYVKKACESIKLINSDAFYNIIKMSGDEYMEKLFKIRDFSKL